MAIRSPIENYTKRNKKQDAVSVSKKKLGIEFSKTSMPIIESYRLLENRARIAKQIAHAWRSLSIHNPVATSQAFNNLIPFFAHFYSMFRASELQNAEKNIELFKKYVSSQLPLTEKIKLFAISIRSESKNETEQTISKIAAFTQTINEKKQFLNKILCSLQELEPLKMDDVKSVDDIVMQLYALDRELQDEISSLSDFFSGTSSSFKISERAYLAYYNMRKALEDIEKIRENTIHELKNAKTKIDEYITDELVVSIQDIYIAPKIDQQYVNMLCERFNKKSKNENSLFIKLILLKIAKIAAVRKAYKKFGIKQAKQLEERLINGLIELETDFDMVLFVIQSAEAKEIFDKKILDKIQSRLKPRNKLTISVVKTSIKS